MSETLTRIGKDSEEKGPAASLKLASETLAKTSVLNDLNGQLVKSQRPTESTNISVSTPHPSRAKNSHSRFEFVFLSHTILALALLSLGSACVSVKIGDGQVKRSEGVQWEAPPENFQKLETPRADAAWKNSKNGNTIAYQSACGESSEAPLESVAQELLSAFDSSIDPQIQRRPFDGREAIDLEADGKIDGVATRMRAVLYRKNGCSYVLTQIGRTQIHQSDREAFEKFTRSFRAP